MTRMGYREEDWTGHPDGEQVAAYVERKLTSAEREELEAHLAECADCRREVAEVTLFLRRERSGRRRWLIPSLATAAAAALLLIVVRAGDVDDPGGTRFREFGEAEALPAIEAVSPAPEAVLPPGEESFTWRAAGADAFYRLTVATEEGGVVWREETADTSASLPADIRLAPGRTYYWFVDALLPDGREATTGVRRFRAAP